jgi:hypothetical protein
MIEQYGHRDYIDEFGNFVDEFGNVRHRYDDLSVDTVNFDELAPTDQDMVIEIIDDMPHHVVDEALPVHHDALSIVPEPHEQQDTRDTQSLYLPAERHLPPTAHELEKLFSAKKIARQAIEKAYSLTDERDRPYYELGGRASQDDIEQTENPLETITVGAKAWMRDVHDMLRYGIPELTPEALEAMNRDDKQLLALHFQGLWDRIPTAERLISWGNGDVATHPFLEGRYGKSRSPEEMKEYMLRLTALDTYLQATPVAWLLRQAAYDGFRSKKERDAKYVRDRKKKGEVQVVLGEDGIYHTERLAPGIASAHLQ